MSQRLWCMYLSGEQNGSLRRITKENSTSRGKMPVVRWDEFLPCWLGSGPLEQWNWNFSCGISQNFRLQYVLVIVSTKHVGSILFWPCQCNSVLINQRHGVFCLNQVFWLHCCSWDLLRGKMPLHLSWDGKSNVGCVNVFPREAFKAEFSNAHVHSKDRIKYLKAFMLVKSFD